MALIKGKQIDADTLNTTQIDNTGTVSTVNAGDAAVTGTGPGIAPIDHQHATATAAPAASSVSAGAPAEGAASTFLRSDASIQADVSGALDSIAAGQASNDGTGNGLALKTHSHAAPVGTAVEITDSTNSTGAAGTFSDSGHQHAHGNRGGGTLHANATGAVDGFMSATDKAKLDALVDPLILSPKDSVRLLSLTNITPLSGATAVDGSATVVGDRVALFGQTTSTEDGIYIVQAGAWVRADDFEAATGQAGAVFAVEEGGANGDTFWQVTNDSGSDVVGTDDLGIAQIGAGSPRGAGAGLVLNVNDLDVVANGDGSIVVNANDIQVGVITEAQHGNQPINDGLQHAVATGALNGYMSAGDKTKLDGITAGAEPNAIDRQEAVTTELITNSDTVLADVLNNIPLDSALSLSLYLNGVHQKQGAGLDYTVNPTTGAITWLASSGTAVNMQTNDDLWATYKA